MRVISGFLGGRKIKGKFPDSVRPTTDMTRETLFNILTNTINLEDKKVLDLFAGTGLLGIEAISHSAKSVDFFDISYKNISQLIENLKLFKIQDLANAEKANFQTVLNTRTGYDIIFADPPYDKNYYDKIVQKVAENDVLNRGGYLILESRSNKKIDILNFELVKEREVGSSKLIFLKKN